MNLETARICLQNSPVFSKLKEEQAALLLYRAAAEFFPKGEVLFKRGDHSDASVYMIVLGKLATLDDEGAVERSFDTGNVIGEIASTGSAPRRTRTVIAEEDCSALRWDLDELKDSHPELGAAVRSCFDAIIWLREKYLP